MRTKNGSTKPKPDAADWTAALCRFGEYLKDAEKARTTQDTYYLDLIDFTGWYQGTFGERPVLQLIQAEELRRWRTHLREARRLAPATVNRKLAALRSLLRWCESEGLCAEIRTPKRIRQVQPPPRWLSPQERRALLRALDRFANFRDPAIVRFLLNTGLRVEEYVKVQWRDIRAGERSGSVTVREGKGRKQRTIPLNSEAREALAVLRELAQVVGKRTRPTDPISYGQRGALTIRGIQATVAKAGKLARIDDVTPHVLRHTFAKEMERKGVPLHAIAELLGHESLDTTRRYVQPGQDDLAAAVETIAGGRDD